MLINKKENGKAVSPKLAEHIKNFLVDIDGTVCEDIPNEEPERMLDAVVYADAIKKINEWFDEGHIITFFTSRTEAHREVTEKYLEAKGFKYHNLLMGKPRGGNYIWIDNHPIQTVQYTGKFTDIVEAKGTIKIFK